MSHSATIGFPAQIEPIWVLGDQLRFLGTVGGRDLHIVEVSVPPGSGTPPHRHASLEIFQVVRGEITFGLFEESPPRQVAAGPGTVVTIPPDLAHNYTNLSAEPAVMTVVLEGQMCEFFREVGSRVPPPPGPPSPATLERLAAACRRHGIELLGPG